MSKDIYQKQLIKLCVIMLNIGIIGFGGGSALIPVIYKYIVKHNHLISRKEFEKNIMIANITPGALPIEVASSVGNTVYGLPGMILGAVMLALPGTIETILILMLFENIDFKITKTITYISIIVTFFVLTILLNYIIETIKICIKSQNIISSIGFMFLAFFMTCGKEVSRLFGLDKKPLLCLSTIQFLGLAFLIIFLTGIKSNEGKNRFHHVFKKKLLKQLLREECGWIIFAIICSLPAVILYKDLPIFVVKVLLSSLVSFGGGDAYLAVADGFFVDSEMITNELFYSKVVTIANILPGSIMCKVLAGIGYIVGKQSTGVIGGIFVALSGFSCAIAASGGTFSLVSCFYDQLDEFTFFIRVKKYIRPIISGFLITISIKLLSQIILSCE